MQCHCYIFQVKYELVSNKRQKYQQFTPTEKLKTEYTSKYHEKGILKIWAKSAHSIILLIYSYCFFQSELEIWKSFSEWLGASNFQLKFGLFDQIITRLICETCRLCIDWTSMCTSFETY